MLVEAAAVRGGRLERAVEEDGKTRVRERYVVSAPPAGRRARIALKADDEVSAGAPVATPWPSVPAMVDARTFRELNARVGAAEAGVQQSRANVAREEASLDIAQTDLTRRKQLQREGFALPSALDQAELALRVQARALEAARFARDGAVHDLAQARGADAGAGRCGDQAAGLGVADRLAGRRPRAARVAGERAGGRARHPAARSR